jgi:hypothetical protein
MKIPDGVREALEETRLPWGLETGGKHYKVKLAGRLVGVLPKGKHTSTYKRSILNTIAQVRRAAKEIKNQ